MLYSCKQITSRVGLQTLSVKVKSDRGPQSAQGAAADWLISLESVALRVGHPSCGPFRALCKLEQPLPEGHQGSPRMIGTWKTLKDVCQHACCSEKLDGSKQTCFGNVKCWPLAAPSIPAIWAPARGRGLCGPLSAELQHKRPSDLKQPT